MSAKKPVAGGMDRRCAGLLYRAVGAVAGGHGAGQVPGSAAGGGGVWVCALGLGHCVDGGLEVTWGNSRAPALEEVGVACLPYLHRLDCRLVCGKAGSVWCGDVGCSQGDPIDPSSAAHIDLCSTLSQHPPQLARPPLPSTCTWHTSSYLMTALYADYGLSPACR